MRQAYDNLQPGGWVEVVDFEAWVGVFLQYSLGLD